MFAGTLTLGFSPKVGTYNARADVRLSTFGKFAGISAEKLCVYVRECVRKDEYTGNV
jgi:hypothetical protein